MENDREKLRLMGLPIFSNEGELAELIHVTPGLIRTIIISPERFYRRYNIPKSNGSLRKIRQPSRSLKGIQAWILRNILDKISATQYATAYIKGKNIFNNVYPHSNNRYFICLDLEDFFPSISMNRVLKKFLAMGYSDTASYILARLCTCDFNLPQGAITSPSLSNLVAAQLDRRIAGYTSKTNIVYTRYADDITLSSNNRDVLRRSLSRILKIIKAEHFNPNMSKLRVLGPGKRCSITGFVKHDMEGQFGIGQKKKRQMRTVMHHYIFGLNKDAKYASEASLNGWLNYLKDVDKESHKQMSSYWNRLKEKAKAV